MIKMKRYPFLILIIVVFSTLFYFRSFASVLTDQNEVDIEVEKEITGFVPDGYNYYICEKWDYEGTFVIGFFREKPMFDTTLHREGSSDEYFYHCKSSDDSKITFYDFFDEENMFNYIYANDNTVKPENCRIRVDYLDYMRLVPDHTVYYTNVDLIPTDTGVLYAAAHPFAEKVTETVTGEKTTFVGFDSNTLISGVTKEMLSIVPVVLVVLICFVSIDKGVAFLFKLIRGA